MIHDVIIIGGGIYGSACSYFLKNDSNTILLLEKDKIGNSGATSYSKGIVRVYDPDMDLAELSFKSIHGFLNWEKNKYPGKSPYVPSGFLYLLDEKNLDKVATYIDSFNCDDYPIDIVSSNALKKKIPWLQSYKNKIGVLEKYGGYGYPSATAENFVQGFKSKKGEVYENCKVHGINQLNDKTWEVQLSEEKLQCKVLLLTAGAYTKELIPELPTFSRAISLTQVENPQSRINLSVVDETIKTYIRPEGETYYAGSQVFDIADVPSELSSIDDKSVEDSLQRLNGLLAPEIEKNPINNIKGFDGYTNQTKPIIQFMDDFDGLFVATGFSGRGYKCSIEISKMIATQVHNYIAGKPIENNIKWRYHY